MPAALMTLTSACASLLAPGQVRTPAGPEAGPAASGLPDGETAVARGPLNSAKATQAWVTRLLAFGPCEGKLCT